MWALQLGLCLFMPLTRRVPEALCFRVVRPSVRTGISLTQNLKNPWVDFYTWPRGAPWRVDELIRFWARSTQGQWTWSKYAIFNLVNAKSQEPLGGLWGAPPGVDELIRFWARSAQRQRSKVNELGLNMLFSPRFKTRNLKNPWVDRDPPKVRGQWTWSKYAIFTSLTRNLKNPWVDFHQTWYRGAPPGVDELIRFWARSAQRQRSKFNELGLNMLFLPR